MLLLFVVFVSVSASGIGYGRITASSLNIRSGAGTHYSVVVKLNRDTEVQLLSKEGTWYKIKKDNTLGYAHANYITLFFKKGRVTASALNVRSGCSTVYNKIGALYQGDVVDVVDEDVSGWMKLKTDSLSGCASATYISIEDAHDDDGGDVIDGITHAQWKQMCKKDISAVQLKDLNDNMAKYGINTNNGRIRHFLSQIMHESGCLRWLKEISSGSYLCGRKSLCMEDCFGTCCSKFRGAGAIQLTGKCNYQGFAKSLGDNKIMSQGCEYVAANYPISSAMWWWQNNGMNRLCDQYPTDVSKITKRVNGGYNGLEDRKKYWRRAKELFP
ncbi:hypothetical protein PCE1_004545 [Barthelona sp. PCE]